MAQPHDIEDVLTSIRRLVRAEPARASGLRDYAPPATDDVDDGDALVLAAASRVSDPDDPFQTIRIVSETEETTIEPIPGDISDEFADALADAFAADLAAEIAADIATEDAPEGTDATSAGGASIIDLRPGEGDVQDLAQRERDGRDAEHVLDDLDAETAAITEDMCAVEEAAAAWIAEAEATAPANAPDDDREEVGADAPARPEGIEPVDIFPEALAETLTPDADLVHDAADAVDDDPDARTLGDIGIGDDALRGLITEIVRQELTGEVGERITRNVRKLVRRELRDLLSAQALD